MPTKLTVISQLPNLQTILLLGRKSMFQDESLAKRLGVDKETWAAMLKELHPSHKGASTSTRIKSRRVILAALPETCSRHNSPSRAWAVPALVAAIKSTDQAGIIPLVSATNLEATLMAIARGIPSFSQKSKTSKVEVFIEVNQAQNRHQILIDGVRYAAELFDRPPNDLRVSAFVDEAHKVAKHTNTEIRVIQGQELRKQGFGGIIGVGQGANDGPAMVTLHWKPENPTGSVAWVGKGIVYDTGGLSIKSKTGMPNMKGDMGGAGAVLAAFQAAALLQVPYQLTAVLCLAENSVGPNSTRPDDILLMKSGKTVEVNNTDAEGRLVLADGVSWAANHTNCDTIIDMATLTGAAPMSVGKNMAAVYCNDEALEQHAVSAGRQTGELCFPVPYTPEFYYAEFASVVADMKNSVKNRANAQSACAGQFIGNHLPASNHRWLHLDIAGPAWGANKRGSGFGVGLLLGIGHLAQ